MNIETSDLKNLVLEALDDSKAKDTTVMDVRDRSSVTDFMIVTSGTSNRHLRTIAETLISKAKEVGEAPLGSEGERDSEWVLVDLGDIIVHIMLPRVREFYNLEKLWAETNHELDTPESSAN